MTTVTSITSITSVTFLATILLAALGCGEDPSHSAKESTVPSPSVAVSPGKADTPVSGAAKHSAGMMHGEGAHGAGMPHEGEHGAGMMHGQGEHGAGMPHEGQHPAMAGGMHEGDSVTASVAEDVVPDALRGALGKALVQYDVAASALVSDDLAGLKAPAGELERLLGEAQAAASAAISPQLKDAAAAAKGIGAAADLEKARHGFGELSRALIQIVGRSSSLAKGRFVFRCPMAKGYKKWMQSSADLRNPYMGQAMPGCGSTSDWKA